MRLKQKILALICAGALLLGLAPAGAAETEVIFLALNEQFMPLSTYAMPISANNSIYVPYSIFDSNVSGVDLIVKVAADSKQVMLYTRQKYLQFDLASGTCTDKDGGTGYPRALIRGGIIYLPASTVGSYFKADGLTYSYHATDYGPLIRFTTPSVILDNAQFLDVAPSAMADYLREYRRSQNPVPSPVPTPPPSPPPTVTPPPIDPERPDKRGIRVYLAFTCTDGAGRSGILNALRTADLSAVFFFRPQDLSANEAGIRRLVASGHVVGLMISGGSAESMQAQLAEGNRLLELIAHMNTRTVLVEGGDPAASAALTAEG
ncbi:MAG: hypothetical protein RR281_04940, partial [Pseudoflavonifractor sp.]